MSHDQWCAWCEWAMMIVSIAQADAHRFMIESELPKERKEQ
jgi:hypothetical protein